MGHGAAVYEVAYSRDGRYIASSSDDGTVRVWDVASGQARVLEGHTAQVYSAGFDPEASRVISGSGDRTARLWDLATGDNRIVHRASGTVKGVRFSSDGRFVASFTEDDTVSIWDPHATAAFETYPSKLRAWLAAQTSAEVDETGAIASSDSRHGAN